MKWLNSLSRTARGRQRLLSVAVAVFTLPVVSVVATSAQDTPAAAYTGSMGSVTVGDEQWYRLAFRPDVPVGNWGFAFDVELFINSEGDFSDRGWEFDNSTQTLDTVLRKLYYVRYGKPDDDTFVKIGALDNVSLGYGLIMNNYRNTLEYPGVKKTGLQFHLRDLGSMHIGIEGVVNNFQDFQEEGGLVGVRVSTKAAGKLEFGATYVVDLNQYSGLLDRDDDGYPDVVDAFPDNENLALDNDRDGVDDGVDVDDDNDGIFDIDADSGLPEATRDELTRVSENFDGFPVDDDVTRRDPFSNRQADGDRFAILGLDAAYPIVDEELLSVKLYGQFAMLLDDDDELSPAQAAAQGVAAGNRKAEGIGVVLPGLALGMGPLDGQFEFRHFRDDFDSDYFDNLYELDRARLNETTGQARSKDAGLARGKSQSGVFGRIGTDLQNLFYASADYQYLTGGDDPKQQVHASAQLSKRLLDMVPRLNQAGAYYQKNNIGVGLNEDGTGDDGFLESTEDTFYGYVIDMEVSGGVSIQWDTRFLFARGADGRLDRERITTIETVMSF